MVWVTRGRLVDRRQLRRRRVLVQLAGLSLALTSLTACSGDNAEHAAGERRHLLPDGAAQTLADALASGDFADVGFETADPAAVTEEYAAVVEGLEDLTPTVTLADVSEPSGDAGHRRRRTTGRGRSAPAAGSTPRRRP